MKLLDLKENAGYRSYQEREHMSDMVRMELENGRFSPEINRALDALTDEQWEALVTSDALMGAALDNYDYADDSGETIHLTNHNVEEGLSQIGYRGAR